MMHPRSTRNRPLLILGQKKVYTNNIRSPDRKKNLLIQELFGLNGVNSVFVADAVSCYKVESSTTSCHSVCFIKFMVDFWDANSRETEVVFQVGIHAPSDWSLHCFVDAIEEVSMSDNILSLIFGYYINGKHFPYVTINALYHRFKIKNVFLSMDLLFYKVILCWLLTIDIIVAEHPEWIFG